MDVADDVVDIIPVDDELGEARGDEEPLEVLAGSIELGTDDLIARQETVAHLQLCEADSVLNDLDLGLYPRGLPVVRAVRQVVLEVQRGEGGTNGHARAALPRQEEDKPRDPADDVDEWVEQDIDQEQERGEEAHRAVGVRPEGHLGEELTDEEDEQRAEDRLQQQDQPVAIAYETLQPGLHQLCHQQPVDDKGHIIAQQHRRGGRRRGRAPWPRARP